MFIFGLLGYFAGLRALTEVEDMKETLAVKERWKREMCSQDKHFDYAGYCSSCGIKLRNQ